jgi:hypothetical protein
MKKILLLSFMGTCFFSSFAQQSGSGRVNTTTRVRTVPTAKEPIQNVRPNILHNAKTTGVPFMTETFGSGTTTSLPTGWTAGSVGVPTLATWKWRKTATTGQYSIGVINSTTANDGWMVYDSDSIGALSSTNVPFEGWLQSPAYNCTGHSTVQLSFQEHFEKFNDSCYVMVSNNNGLNWTKFSVVANNALSSNASLPSNPYTAKINITSVAANQANVIIRFHYIYKGPVVGGGYNWLIDDVTLSELDPVDIALGKAGIIMVDGTGGITSIGSVPLQLVDSLIPVATLTNDGSTAPTNLSVNAKIYNGLSQVYTQNKTLSSLASGFMDSIIEFPPYVPTNIGNYTVTFDINPTGDVSPANNNDTTDFAVTPTIYDRFGNNVQGSYYVHRPTSGGEASFAIGNTFVIPAGKADSLLSVSMAFGSTTTVGTKVVANIYKFTNSTWNLVANTIEKTLAATDISSSTAVTFTTLNVAPTLSPFPMDEGEYAVVVMGNNVPAASTVLLLYANEATPEFYNILHGIGDTSMNDGANGFAGTGLPFALSGSPLIRLNFNPIPNAVNDINSLGFVGNAYPNPANTEVMIPFTTTEAAEVTVSITNTVGQTVKAINAGKYAANQKGRAVLNVANLSSGVYFYTVEANGQRITKRMVIAH